MVKRIVRFLGLDLARRFGWIGREILWFGWVAFYPAFVRSEQWKNPGNPKTPHVMVMVLRVYVAVIALFVWGIVLCADHHPRLGWLTFCLFLLSPSLRLVVPFCRFSYGKMGLRLKAEKERIRHEWAKTAIEQIPTDLADTLLRPVADAEPDAAILLRPLNGSGS